MLKPNAILHFLLIIILGLAWEVDFFPSVVLKLTPNPPVLIADIKEDQPVPCNLFREKPEVLCTIVPDEMPYFTGCSDLATRSERKKCSDEKLLQFMLNNFHPTLESRGCSRIGVVTFIIDTSGAVTHPRVVRSVYPAFDAEALRVVRLLPNFAPGKRFGKTTPVRYNLPFRIRIE